MSALGQKRTLKRLHSMSALPPNGLRRSNSGSFASNVPRPLTTNKPATGKKKATKLLVASHVQSHLN